MICYNICIIYDMHRLRLEQTSQNFKNVLKRCYRFILKYLFKNFEFHWKKTSIFLPNLVKYKINHFKIYKFRNSFDLNFSKIAF